MKADESEFLRLVASRADGVAVRDLINTEPRTMHYKRAWYLLEKWCHKGWYDYGTTLDLGWLNPSGFEVAGVPVRAWKPTAPGSPSFLDALSQLVAACGRGR